MSYDNEHLSHISPIVVDVESAPLLNAADYFEPVEAAKNLVDPVKIAKDIEQRTAGQMDKASLDFNCARIVALGFWTETSQVQAWSCYTEEHERAALLGFWAACRQRTIVGFCVKTFDLPLMIQRSRYLGIQHPTLDLGRYARAGGVVDLYDLLTFNNAQDTYVMRRTVHNFCRRFGIPVDDTIKGADIPALVAAGEWEKVAAHVTSDVELEVALARRLGVIQPVRETVVL